MPGFRVDAQVGTGDGMPTKYGVTDRDFLIKMLGASKTAEERGMVLILYHTGMHISVLGSLTASNLKREGPRTYLRWVRPKNRRPIEILLPEDRIPDIMAFIKSPKASTRWMNKILYRIGGSAGYDDISAMTFRHTKCINLIREGMPLPVVCQLMGCSLQVVMKAYAKLEQEDLRRLPT